MKPLEEVTDFDMPLPEVQRGDLSRVAWAAEYIEGSVCCQSGEGEWSVGEYPMAA